MAINLPRLPKPARLTLSVRAAIMLAILAFDILLGMRADVNLFFPIIVLVGGATFFVVFFRHIEWGILMLLPATFFGRWDVGTGTNVAFNLTILLYIFLLGIWLLKMILFDRHVALTPSNLNVPALVFLAVLILSFIVGNIRWIPQASTKATLFAQLGGLLLYGLSISALLMPGNLIKELRILKIVVWQFLILGFFYIYGYLLPYIGQYVGKILVSGGVGGSSFWIWSTAFATSYLIAGDRSDKKRTVFLILLLAAILYRGLFLYREWVSGWGPPLVAVAVILLLRNWRFAFVVAIIAAVLIGIQFSDLSAAVMTDTQQYSAYSRTATWPILFDLIKASPIFGLGPSNYYYYTPLFSLLGWHVSFNSHNNYLDIVAQYGFVGFFVFIWLVVEIVRLAWRLKSEVQDEFSRVYVNTCIGGLAGMLASGMLGDWFFPFLYNISTAGFRFSVINWFFLGGLVIVEQALKQQKNET